MEIGKPARSILERPDLIIAPQWSADGKQIVMGVGRFPSFLDFTAGNKKPVDAVNGGAQVAMLNDDGSGFKMLTSGANNNAFPSFAPDGKRIVYRTLGPEGQGLRIMTFGGWLHHQADERSGTISRSGRRAATASPLSVATAPAISRSSPSIPTDRG